MTRTAGSILGRKELSPHGNSGCCSFCSTPTEIFNISPLSSNDRKHVHLSPVNILDKSRNGSAVNLFGHDMRTAPNSARGSISTEDIPKFSLQLQGNNSFSDCNVARF